MTPESQLACVMGVMFFATLTRSTFGFGEALVAVPLLSLVMKVETASAVVAITSIASSFAIMITSTHVTDWRGARWLLVSSLAGIPVGVYVLIHVPEFVVKNVLAAVLIAFSLFRLSPRFRWQIQHDEWGLLFGFLGGVLGGAYNTSGPPLVIFGTLRGWDPARFRATLQTVFLANALVVLTMHCLAGLWSSEVIHFAAWVLPLLAITVPLGYVINRRIHPEHFHRALYVILLVIGVTLACSTTR